MSRRDPTRGQSEIIVFGRHPLEESLVSAGVEVLEVVVAKGRPPAERKTFRRLADSRGLVVQELSRG